MKTALLIHGAYGSPDENWIPWLGQELEKLGFQVLTPVFPTPENQTLERWLDVALPYLGQLDQESVLVGHSIGAVFLLSILEKLERPVQTAVFASGFLHDLGHADFDSINQSFYDKEFDWRHISRSSLNTYVFHGDDDPNVPFKEAEHLSAKLRTEVKVIRNGGHLNQSAGFVEFPELLEVLVSFNSRKALIIPFDSTQRIFLQNRHGHKNPDRGYFGGGIESGETPLGAALRGARKSSTQISNLMNWYMWERPRSNEITGSLSDTYICTRSSKKRLEYLRGRAVTGLHWKKPGSSLMTKATLMKS